MTSSIIPLKGSLVEERNMCVLLGLGVYAPGFDVVLLPLFFLPFLILDVFLHCVSSSTHSHCLSFSPSTYPAFLHRCFAMSVCSRYYIPICTQDSDDGLMNLMPPMLWST